MDRAQFSTLTFTPAEVRSLTNVEPRHLEYLVREGAVRVVTEGQGVARVFTFDNLVEVALASALIICRVPVPRIGFLFDQLRDRNVSQWYGFGLLRARLDKAEALVVSTAIQDFFDESTEDIYDLCRAQFTTWKSLAESNASGNQVIIAAVPTAPLLRPLAARVRALKEPVGA